MSTAPSPDTHLIREMSITHNEFFRLLPRAVNDAAVARQGNRIDITTGTGLVKITLAPETVRKLAMLEFPVTEVTIEFNGFSASERVAFLARFDLAYQKGGG